MSDPCFFDVTVWGARGTLPASGPDQVAFGTETCCVEMRIGTRRLIFDAGTGIVPLGRAMAEEGTRLIDLFFSHVHYDHIMGFPFFMPFYRPGTHVSVALGHMLDGQPGRELISDFMRAPFLPIGPKVFKADVDYLDFKPGDVLEPARGIHIRTARLNHPNGAVGYRVEHGGRVVSYVTDTEHVPGETDEAVLSLFEGADIVFYDTSYDDSEMERFRHYGHSSWQEGVRLARRAGARKLVLFHHMPMRDDDCLAEMEAKAKAIFPGAVAGRSGMSFSLASARAEAEAG